MFDWQIFAVLAPLFFVSYQALAKLLPKNTSVFLVNAYAYVVGAFFMLIAHMLFSQSKSLSLPDKALPLAIGIGALVSIGTLFVIKGYSLGAPSAVFNSIYSTLFIVFGIILGIIFFNEKINFPQVVGAFLSVAGILVMIYFKNR